MSGSASGGAQVGIGALQILQAKQQADALKRQGQFQAQQDEFNAKLLDFQKQDLAAKTDLDIKERGTAAKQMIGAQKVSLAAQGIDVEGQIGQDLANQELQFAADDINTIKNNAWRQAFGIEIEQTNLRQGAKAKRISSVGAANATLATGGLRGASTILEGAGKFRGTGPAKKTSKRTWNTEGRA